jgi:hypothetical protein
MAPRIAMFYAEQPLAVLRDFETERDRDMALRGIQRALDRASDDDPLALAAFRLRQARRIRNVIGTGEAARRIVAWRDAGLPAPRLDPAPQPPRRAT